MDERRHAQRHRALLGGKVIFNDRRSVIDCLIRNLSDHGVSLQVESTMGVPRQFGLIVDGEGTPRQCRKIWASQERIGAEFIASTAELDLVETTVPLVPSADPRQNEPAETSRSDLVRMQLLTLRAALDEIEVGVVLLDAETRAQFINRAFRRMWRLPDEKADSKPPFVALMYHGRDTRAYAVREDQLDAYVAERVALVKAGDPRPLDLRLANGEVIRMTCTMLPAGGRMLCYSYITDIVRSSDELRELHSALNDIPQGLLLLDNMLNVKFMNRAAQQMWAISDSQLKRGLSFIQIASNARSVGMYDVDAGQLEKFVRNRIAIVRAGDPTPVDIPHRGGRVLRSVCNVLPGGGRMVYYSDVTDLVQRAHNFERLANTDSMTGVRNRREFDQVMDAEWNRFQRYHRPLALLLIDVDRFKDINDSYGHVTGDRAIVQVAALCNESKRSTDILARLGGDEFALLLPETDQEEALLVAERLCRKVERTPLDHSNAPGAKLTLSIGHAQATASMSGPEALMKVADAALYKAKAAGRNCVRTSVSLGSADLRAAAE